jgi:predicted permease
MASLLRELTDAVRRLRRHRRFTAFAILLLAFGIGTTVAMLGIAYRLLLRPLPFSDADRLARLRVVSTWNGERQVNGFSFPWYEALRSIDGPFVALAAHQSLEVNRTGDDRPERMRLEVATASYFPLLGVEPALGRLYTTEEDSGSGAAVLVISHGLWHRRWGGSPSAVGDTLRIGATPFTVVGVLPKAFGGLTGTTEAWAPLAMSPLLYYEQALESPWNFWLEVLGRLRPGMTVAAASTSLARTVPDIAAKYPLPMEASVTWNAEAEPLRRALTPAQLRTAVLVLLGAVAFVLLISCANVAGLLLVQGRTRRREMAVRVSLGSSRAGLLRSTLWESLLITVAGAGAGLVVAAVALRFWLSSALARDIAAGESDVAGLFGLSSHELDGGAVAASLGIALIVGLLLGLAPAVDAARCQVVEELRGCQRKGLACRPRRPEAKGLALVLFAEVAVALVLLIGASLMFNSLRHLLSVDGGFDPDHVVSFRLELPRSEYPTGQARASFIARLWQGLSALPGVAAVSVDPCTPWSGECPSTLVTYWRGRRPDRLEEAPQVRVHYVTPDHLSTLGARLASGRGFDARDTAGAPPVVLVNRAAARRLFPAEDPLGQRLALAVGLFRDPAATAEVVGVVDDVRYEAPADPVDSAVYVSALQFATASTFVLVRAAFDPLDLVPSIRGAVRRADPDLPVFDVRRLEDRVGDAFARPRTIGTVLGMFAAVATVLAGMGIYAVISFAVTRGRRELGVRFALGASRPHLARAVLAAAGVPLCLGVGVGLGGAWLASHEMVEILGGVSPRDPVSWTSAPAVLLLAAALAGYLPARRAGRVDPADSLRSD